MKQIIKPLAVAIAALYSHTAIAETCNGYPNVNIDMSAVETQRDLNHQTVCAGVGRAVDFFAAIDGLSEKVSNAELRLTVQDEVIFDRGGDMGPMRVYGIYDRAENMVTVSAWGTDYLHDGSRDAFTMPVNLEFHTSVVAHETAHMILQAITANKELASAQHEFWAYAVQIATMNETERNLVAEAYSTDEFDSELQINDFVHYGNPHKFGAMSYKWMETNGLDLHMEILNGTLVNPLASFQ